MSIQFFQDAEKTVIRPELLDEIALRKAKTFFGEKKNRKPVKGKNDKISVSSHQIRKFYNEVKNLQKMLKFNSWETVFPMVKMIKSKIAYATSDSKIKKEERPLYQNFRDFIVEGINSVQDERDFHAFCKYFEAVVGYYYGEGGK